MNTGILKSTRAKILYCDTPHICKGVQYYTVLIPKGTTNCKRNIVGVEVTHHTNNVRADKFTRSDAIATRRQ